MAQVLKLSKEKAFSGAYFGVTVGDWTHVVSLEKANGVVEGKKGCPLNGEMFLSISSTSVGTYVYRRTCGYAREQIHTRPQQSTPWKTLWQAFDSPTTGLCHPFAPLWHPFGNPLATLWHPFATLDRVKRTELN